MPSARVISKDTLWKRIGCVLAAFCLSGTLLVFFLHVGQSSPTFAFRVRNNGREPAVLMQFRAPASPFHSARWSRWEEDPTPILPGRTRSARLFYGNDLGPDRYRIAVANARGDPGEALELGEEEIRAASARHALLVLNEVNGRWIIEMPPVE